MKNISLITILTFFAIGFYMCGQEGERSSAAKSSIEFDTLSHSYGEILFNSDGEYEFVFTNTGKAPLIVSHVKSTCGCTVPEWSKEPINAGQKGRIKVSYDTHRVGAFAKSIYVYSNAENGVIKLMISGKVKPLDS